MARGVPLSVTEEGAAIDVCTVPGGTVGMFKCVSVREVVSIG